MAKRRGESKQEFDDYKGSKQEPDDYTSKQITIEAALRRGKSTASVTSASRMFKRPFTDCGGEDSQELDDYTSKQAAVSFPADVKQSKCLSLQSKKDLLALAKDESHKDEDDAAHAADKDASEAEQVKSEGDEDEDTLPLPGAALP